VSNPLVRSRLAPTPSGLLHIGNAFNFILTWALTRKKGGVLSLRIDDCDASRTRDEFIQDIFDSIDWLGLDYDDGPRSIQEFKSQFSQQIKKDRYQAALTPIQEQTYHCSCSRKEIEQADPSGVYPRTCKEKNLTFQKGKTCIRFSSADLYENPLGDFILWRKDDGPAYQLASTVDDKEAEITLIVRGDDLNSSSLAQQALAKALGYQGHFTKIHWIHHPLLLDPNGNKLSKTAGSFSLSEIRASQKSPGFLYQKVAKYLNLEDSESILNAHSLLKFI